MHLACSASSISITYLVSLAVLIISASWKTGFNQNCCNCMFISLRLHLPFLQNLFLWTKQSPLFWQRKHLPSLTLQFGSPWEQPPSSLQPKLQSSTITVFTINLRCWLFNSHILSNTINIDNIVKCCLSLLNSYIPIFMVILCILSQILKSVIFTWPLSILIRLFHLNNHWLPFATFLFLLLHFLPFLYLFVFGCESSFSYHTMLVRQLVSQSSNEKKGFVL